MNNIYKILLFKVAKKHCVSIKKEFVDVDYKIDTTNNTTDAITLFRTRFYSLIIIDATNLNNQALELCKYFREDNKDVGIIFLSPILALKNKLQAFECGVDKYVIKPVATEELIARINVMVKRTQMVVNKTQTITLDNIELNIATKTVLINSKEINLNIQGFKLLHLFITNRNVVFSNIELLEKVWHLNFSTKTNRVGVAIFHLRKSIEKEIGKQFIYSKTGFGYYIK